MKDEKGRMNMDIDEDFEIPTFLPPKHPSTGLIDIEVKCPICDEQRTVLFTPDYMEDPSFADSMSEVWGVVCEDCQTLAVNFCEENSMDAESSDDFQKRLDCCGWDIAVINIMRRYREIHHGMEDYRKRLLPATAACPVCGVEHSWAIPEGLGAPFDTTVLSWPCRGCNDLFHFFCEVHNFPAEIIDRSFWDLVNNRGDIGCSLKEYLSKCMAEGGNHES